MEAEANKDQISALGREFSVVTPYTSLIVLEGIDDYVRYGITPPDEKTKEQYSARMAQAKDATIRTNKSHEDQVAADFQKIVEWWKTDYKPMLPAKHAGDTTGDMNARNYNVQSYRRPLIDAQDIRSQGSFSAENVAATTAGVTQTDAGGSVTVNGSRGDEVQYIVNGHRMTGNSSSANGALAQPGTATYAWKAESSAHEMNSAMNLKGWDSKEPYMAEIKNVQADKLYEKYLSMRDKYKDMPSFYIDIADYFEQAKKHDEALRILSNLAEIRPDDYRLMRVLAHRLEQWHESRMAIAVYQEVLKVKSEEPQSYRDLGLALADDKQYQKAADMLCRVVNKQWDVRFPEIEALTACEIDHLADINGAAVKLDSLDKRLIKQLPVDIRVVIDWDADNCDIDLWVTDPSGEKCLYSNPLTKSGGRISRDFTGGYGPEEFKLKKAIPGKYKVEVHYFGDRQQTLSGPTTVHAQMYTNYGKANEQKKELALRLASQKEVVYVGDFEFTK
jgi:tetratricopeptide (TPR) repeat protein